MHPAVWGSFGSYPSLVFSHPLTLHSSSLSCLPPFPRYRLSAPLCPASNSTLLAPSSARAPRASLVDGAAPRCPASYSTLLAPSSARAPRSSLIAGAVRRSSCSAVPRGSLAALLSSGSLRSGSVWGQCRRWRWLSPARLIDRRDDHLARAARNASDALEERSGGRTAATETCEGRRGLRA